MFQSTATKILEAWYDNNKRKPYPNKKQKAELAKKTSLTETQVGVWFQNKRQRAKNKVVSELILLVLRMSNLTI